MNFALSNRLQGLLTDKDSALKIIKTAEIDGIQNVYLDKMRGIVYGNAHEFERSDSLLKNYLKEYPNDFDSLHSLALNLFNQGKKAESIVYLEKARKINPNSPKLLLLSQDIYH